jgi:hypothetical protein
VQNAGLRPPLVLVGHSFGGYSFVCITTRTPARHRAWCLWIRRSRMRARFKACLIARCRRFRVR